MTHSDQQASPNPWQGFSFPGETFNRLLDISGPRPDDYFRLETSSDEPDYVIINTEGKQAWLDRTQARTLANALLMWLDEGKE